MHKNPTNPEHYFYCDNGIILKSLENLRDFFDRAQKENHTSFDFHVNNANNDFSNWIYGVFGLKELAEILREIKDPYQAKNVLQYFLEHQDDEKENNKLTVKTVKDEEHKKVENEPEIKELENDKEYQNMNKDQKDIVRHTKLSEMLLDKIKQVKKNITEYKSEALDKVEVLLDEYQNIYREISDARKNGKDVFIAQTKLKHIKPKIKYYELSGNIEDYDYIVNLLKDVKNELEEAKKYVEPDLKKEVIKGLEEVDNKDIYESKGVEI